MRTICPYNIRMDIHEINAILEARGMTGQDLADQLGVVYDAFRRVLSGKRPLTEQLARHIRLVLDAPQNAMLIYKVDLTSQQVYDLTAQQQFPAGPAGDKQRAIAVAAVLQHNMRTLAEMARRIALPDELRGLIAMMEQQPGVDARGAAEQVASSEADLEAAEEDPPTSAE